MLAVFPLAMIIATWGLVLSQPVIPSGGISDVTYDGRLYISLINGTVMAYGDGTQAWKLTFESYGAPALLTPAPPYGLLILTDMAWLGLVACDGQVLGWMKIDVDPNAIVRGRGKLLYSNGLALVYADRTALAVRVPELKLVGRYGLKNSFLGGSISPHGDSVLLYGFDTLCSFCIQNEEKLVLVIKPETGEQIYRNVVNQLRDAAVLWRRNWLVLAKWDAMYIYDLGGEVEKPIRVYMYASPIDRWLSWGFSPSGSLFHYILAEGGSLSVIVIDVESGSIVSKSLPIATGRRVLSSLDDDFRLAVVSYNTPVEAAYVLFGNLAGEMLSETVKDLGTPKTVKITKDKTIALFSGGFVVLPPLTFSVEKREEPPLAYLRVDVMDEEGRPYQGALVCVNASCAKTSQTGTATFTLREGMYVLMVRHTQARELQTTILVQGNMTKLVALQRLYTLNVDVSSGKGAPRRCSIRVYDAQGGMLGEAEGCTATLVLARGVYAVEVETAELRIRRVTTVQGDTILHFIVAENEKATIVVSAFDENGTFLPDAVINVLDSYNVTVVSSKGRLSYQLTPGRYTIQVQRPGYVNWSSTIELNGSLNLKVNLVRIRLSAQVERGPNWAIATAAPVMSSLATAAIAVAVYRFKLVGRLSKLASKARLKLRMRRT